MWKLVIEDDEGKRTVVPLTREDYTIGRKEGNTIRLTERNVSRDHAKLCKKNGVVEAPTNGGGHNGSSYVLEDLTSYNGVYVNGLRVAHTQELVHGDLIQIGDYRIVLQDDAADEESVPMDSDDLKATIPTSPFSSPLRASNAAFLEKPNRLIMLAGPTPGEEYPLVSERLTVGRAEDATISVNHNSVSRLHCEVHALGEARFEIVDKGSSNGVRVNGADLRRGIIEAGDIIELGDVKFKFVGEGQIFRPGVTESQQLAAIGDRTASMVAGGRGRSSLLPAVFTGTLAAAGLIVIYALIGRHNSVPIATTPSATEPPPPPVNADAAMLQDAKHLCDTGDYETAHQKVAMLAEQSPLRQSTDFKYIEDKWAFMMLARADSEPDPATKRSLLEKLANTSSVDPTTRKAAADKLALLDQPPTTTMALVTKDAGAPRTAAAPTHTSRTPTATAFPDNQTSPPTPVPPPSHTAKATPPPPVSPFDLAKTGNPSDLQKARDILEPKVFAKRGSPDEIRLLKEICKTQGDRVCTEQCKALLQ
jgi:pSer/pThr/pTyr-binding forkhead associated (FHA) protein